jgi:hypothetical protein
MADQQAVPAAPAADPKAAAPAAPVAPAPEPTEEYVVEGKKYNLTAKQAKALVQKGLFADQKLQSVDKLVKSSEQLTNLLKTNPAAVFGDKALGANPREVIKNLLNSNLIDQDTKEDIGKWVYENIVQASKKDPKILELERRAKQADDYEKQLKDQEAAQKKQSDEAATAQAYNAIRTEIGNQIKADKTFPENEDAVRLVGNKIRVAVRAGKPITVKQALDLVKKDYYKMQENLFDAVTDDEQFIALIGEARAKRLNDAFVKRFKAKSDKKEEKKQDNSDKKPSNPKEFEKYLKDWMSK